MNQTLHQPVVFWGYALPQWLSANCALVTPLYTCLGAQSNRGTSVMAPSGPTTQGNVYACALGKLHRFHFGHAIGTVNLKILTLLKWLEQSNCLTGDWIADSACCWSFDSTQL